MTTTYEPSSKDEIQTVMVAEVTANIGSISPDFLAELIEIFLEDANSIMDGLETAVVTNDTKRIIQAAHTIKGSSGSMGLKQLSQLSYEMEMLGRNKDITGAAEKLGQMQAEYKQVTAALQMDDGWTQ